MEGRIEIDYDDGRKHESVQVAAEFTDWNPVPLGLDSGTRYAAVFDGAEAAALYHYKFIVDGQWTLLPGLETAHDRAGNVNHFAVAKPIQSTSTQSKSEGVSDDNYGDKNTFTGAYGAGFGADSAPGGGQFGAPAEAAVRQAPEPSNYSSNASTGRYSDDTDFQDVTGFKPDDGKEAKSAREAQQGLSSSSQLRSEPYEFVKETPGVFGSSNHSTQQTDKSYAGAGLTSLGPNSGFDYASEFDRNPARNYTGGSTGALTGSSTDGLTGGLTGGSTSYEYTERQLEKPLESVGGRYQSGYSSKPNTGYEYTDSQLSEPKEAIGALGSSSDGFASSSSKPNTGYEYTETQLLEPKEDVSEGLGKQQKTSSSSYGTSYGTGYDSGYGAASNNKGYDSNYEYKESQLPEPKEDIMRGASGYVDSSQEKPNSSYEYTESDLTKPKEKVSENFTTDDEFADAYEDASMPGSLPFERKVMGGQDVPGNALDAKPRDFATSSSAYGNQSSSSGRGYADSSLSKPETAGEQSFYDSALEQLDEDDEADVFEETRDEPAAELDQATGLPASLSDRTISKSTDYYGGTDSGLDQAAALRAVSDEGPSTPKERRTYEPEPFAATYSPQHHQPIDVNTGFPIDHPEAYGTQQGQQHRGHAPTLRNHEHRRSLKGRDRDPAPPPITSQEHRNAAVIAAASKASAFAKQDVAAISGRIETNRGQTSPAVSRGASVRSSQGYSRPRDSAQYNYSPSSQTQQHVSQPVSPPASQSFAQPTSQPQLQQSSYSSAPRQNLSAQQAPSTTATPSTQTQPRPVLTVGTGGAAGTGAGGATAVPATTAGANSDSYSSASSDASQLQRTQSKKEGRFKRLFKLR